jgi:hypothetical protein
MHIRERIQERMIYQKQKILPIRSHQKEKSNSHGAQICTDVSITSDSDTEQSRNWANRKNMMNQGKPCILRWRQRRGCKRTFWVKNHWGKIGVDGMLTFVPPFSGFMPFWGMSGGLWHERFHMYIVYTCAKAKPKPGNCSSCVLHITELRFFGQIFGEIHNRNRVHRWTQPFLDVKRYRNGTETVQHYR